MVPHPLPYPLTDLHGGLLHLRILGGKMFGQVDGKAFHLGRQVVLGEHMHGVLTVSVATTLELSPEV